MRKVRREIEIFNMSLFDILCGALGAFCFLTLTLFPFYGRVEGAGQAAVRAIEAEVQAIEAQTERLRSAQQSEEQQEAALREGRKELAVMTEKAEKAEEEREKIARIERELARLESTASGKDKTVEALKKEVAQAQEDLREKKNGVIENAFLLVSATTRNGAPIGLRLRGAKSAEGAKGAVALASVAEPGENWYTAEVEAGGGELLVLNLEVCTIKACITIPARPFRMRTEQWNAVGKVRAAQNGAMSVELVSQ